MCDDCGCSLTGDKLRVNGVSAQAGEPASATTVAVLEKLLSDNDRQAAANRRHLDSAGVLAINLMSSPGAGKTTLLESTIDALAGELSIAVIEGDLETENDAARIRQHGVPAVQISTGSACHLDAGMLHAALHELDLARIELLFIENVGNLVCPASFDLGQHRNVTLLSVPEGDDKPAKYPVIFRAADLALLTKRDFLPLMPEFSPERVQDALHAIACDAPLLEVSARSGEGLADWLDWLRQARRQFSAERERGATLTPRLHPEGAQRHASTGSPP